MDANVWVQRTKTLKVFPQGADRLGFLSTLEDFSEIGARKELIHCLELEGTLSVPDLTFLSIQPRSIQQPYRECQLSLAPMQRLVGMSIRPGFSERVKELLGGTAGCTHFLTLVLDVAMSQAFAIYLKIRAQDPDVEPDADSGQWTRLGLAVEPRLENACIALATDGEPMRRVRRQENA